MKFIDLFAGIGAFHIAFKKLNMKCVYASELDPILQECYESNFGIKPDGDITKIDINDIPHHDVLCAGFPCQPFSKAGNMKGDKDLRGQLLYKVMDILKLRQPKYFILENVANFKKNELFDYFFKIMQDFYNIDYIILSPNEFSVPQNRPRIFIYGQLKDLGGLEFKVKLEKDVNIDAYNYLDSCIDKNITIDRVEPIKIEVLEMWNKIIKNFNRKENILSPLWAMELFATYPFEDKTPYNMSADELGRYKGSFGVSLKGLSKKEQLNLLPSYACVEYFPSWKIRFIKNSRKFCLDNYKAFEPVLEQLKKYPASYQKLEWNIKQGSRNIWDYIIQLRPSGVRVKKTDVFPSLVSLNLTQVPIIGKEKRYLSVEEGLSLQSFPCDFILPESRSQSFKALGNSINTKVIEYIASKLFNNK